jgi:hypothetical protein
MSRAFIFVSARDPHAAARAVDEAETPPDLCLISPSSTARRTAAIAVGEHWAEIVEEPLLAARVPAEDGDDALTRLAQALRALRAYDGCSPLVVLDRLDILGATAFTVDEAGLEPLADALERALPVP